MFLVNDIRRAFAVNPHKIPVGRREQATLAARGIDQPTICNYFAWRRSLMVFVVFTTLLSAGLATYRSYTEDEEEVDVVESLGEFFHPALLEEMEYDAESANDEADETEEAEENEVVAAVAKEPQTAFGQFTETVELVALYVLPVAAVAVVIFWTRFQLTFGIMVAAFGFAFLTPLLIALCPWSWWGYVEPVYDRQKQPLEYFGSMAEGLLEGAAYLITLLPTVLSLVPGVQRACIRIKMLLPQSMLPGFFLVMASPFYALFLLVVFVAVNQFDTHPLFFCGMLLFLAAPLTYAFRGELFTKPLTSDDDYRRIRGVQRIVGAMTGLAGVLLVMFLATREWSGVRLLGVDPEHSLLVPLDVVEFLLEVISRSMFITVLGADLFMRLNLTAWKNERNFAGKPEADEYNRIMSEFQRLT